MAGALAHGPQEAMGEEVHPVILGKRRSNEDTGEEVQPKQTKDQVELKHGEEDEDKADTWDNWDDAQASQTLDEVETLHALEKVDPNHVVDNSEPWETWDDAEASQILDDFAAIYNMQPCDELELDLQSVDKTEKVTVEQIPSDAMVEVSNKSEDAEEFMMEAKVVEQMMGSI